MWNTPLLFPGSLKYEEVVAITVQYMGQIYMFEDYLYYISMLEHT